MNIIIAGDGEMGSHLATLLSNEEHDITLINQSKDFLTEIDNQTDILTIVGSPTSILCLQNAGIEKADIFISVMHDEEPNIMACVLAKNLGAKRCISRVSNTENLTPENKDRYKQFGIDNLVSPEWIASIEIVRLIKQTVADEIFEFSGGKLSLFSIKLDERAVITNKSLIEIALEYGTIGLRAIAIQRNGETIIPNGKTTFLIGDIVYLITTPEGIEWILKMGGRTNETIKNIVIIGAGRIGRNVALKLEQELNVKIIEIDKNRCVEISDILKNTLIINGDCRDLKLLEEENIAQMDAFISVTEDSETNILTCLLAKKYGVKKTIALIDNIDFIDVAQTIGIDTIINKKQIAASYIENFTIDADVKSIKCLSGIDADVIELVAQKDSYITKHRVDKLNFPKEAIIGGIVRNNDSFIVKGSSYILEGDKVVVFTKPLYIHKVIKLFN